MSGEKCPRAAPLQMENRRAERELVNKWVVEMPNDLIKGE
jgi:hypothetical protein